MANKKLSKEFVQNRAKELNKVSTHKITFEGEDFDFVVDEKFVKIKEILFVTDLANFATQISLNPKYKDIDGGAIANYALFLVLKHFTDLEAPDDIDESIVLLESLINLDLFGQMVNLLPEVEVERLMNSSTEALNVFAEGTIADVTRMAEEMKQAEIEDLAREATDQIELELETKE